MNFTAARASAARRLLRRENWGRISAATQGSKRVAPKLNA